MSTPIDPKDIQPGQRVQRVFTDGGIEVSQTLVVKSIEEGQTFWYETNEHRHGRRIRAEGGATLMVGDLLGVDDKWFLLEDPIQAVVAGVLNEMDTMADWSDEGSGLSAYTFLEYLKNAGYKVVKA